MSPLSTRRRNCRTLLINVWTFCSQSKWLLYRSWCICKPIRKLRRNGQIAIYFRPTMPRRDCFHLLQICLQNVPVKSNSVFIESLFIESILLTYWILAANIRRYQIFYLAVIWPLYMRIRIVLYVCDIYVLYCVCSFSFLFWFSFFSLMIGKTFVMFGYANKEFEFEFEFVNYLAVVLNISSILSGWSDRLIQTKIHTAQYIFITGIDSWLWTNIAQKIYTE